MGYARRAAALTAAGALAFAVAPIAAVSSADAAARVCTATSSIPKPAKTTLLASGKGTCTGAATANKKLTVRLQVLSSGTWTGVRTVSRTVHNSTAALGPIQIKYVCHTHTSRPWRVVTTILETDAANKTLASNTSTAQRALKC